MKNVEDFDLLLQLVTTEMWNDLHPPAPRNRDIVHFSSDGDGPTLLDDPVLAKKLMEMLLEGNPNSMWPIPASPQEPDNPKRLKFGECIVWYIREALCTDERTFKWDKQALKKHLEKMIAAAVVYIAASYSVAAAVVTDIFVQALKFASRITAKAFCAWVTNHLQVEGIAMPPKLA